MKRLRQDIWVVLALLLILVITSMFMIHKSSTNEGMEFAPKRTTYMNSPSGVMALYETIHALGYPTSRQVQPFTSPIKDGVLFVLSPDMPISEFEQKSVKKWVQRGNVLVIAENDVTDGWEPGKEPKTSVSKAVRPSFFTVSRVETAGNDRIYSNKWEFAGEKFSVVSLFADTDATTVGYTRLGKGAVILLSDSWVFSNQGIGRKDNLTLAISALSYRSPGKKVAVIFDEYHHGYSSGGGILSLLGEPARLGLMQLLAAFVVLVLALARRFGRPVPLLERARERSEYLYSMAHLLKRAHANRVVQTEFDRKFIGEMAHLTGLAPTAKAEEVLRAAEVLYPDRKEELNELISPARVLSESELIRLTRRRNRFRKEITGKR